MKEMGIHQMGMGFWSCSSDGHRKPMDKASIPPQQIHWIASMTKQRMGIHHRNHHRNRRNRRQQRQSSKVLVGLGGCKFGHSWPQQHQKRSNFRKQIGREWL